MNARNSTWDADHVNSPDLGTTQRSGVMAKASLLIRRPQASNRLMVPADQNKGDSTICTSDLIKPVGVIVVQ